MADKPTPARREPVPPRQDPQQPWRAEGVPPKPPQPGSRGRLPRPPRSTWIFWALLIVIFGSTYLSSRSMGQTETATVPYTEFTKQVQSGNVKDIYTKGFSIEGKLKSGQPQPSNTKKKYTNFKTERPAFAQDNIFSEMVSKGVVIEAAPINQPRSFLSSLIISLLPIVLFIGLWIAAMAYVSKRAGGGMLGSLKRTPKPLEAGEKRATFADVAGIDEVENEVSEVVDFLKYPDKYRRLGAKIPRGVLLTGPPGTGKTLLARAVAGEANVPFYSAAASEFIEMVVGVGAKRVRELFEEARKTAPSIVFIDEIDTIGRSRGGSTFGGSDEREQTLNQILTEMDGFSGSEGVVVIAATNRPDVLDSALLRPGRFDRQISVPPPDLEGRVQILKVHTRGVPVGPDVDLAAIAKMTPGMTGADLANLVNEAALLAVKRERKDLSMREFAAALDKVQLGTARVIVIPEEERRRTAYHESGHAILGMLFARRGPGAEDHHRAARPRDGRHRLHPRGRPLCLRPRLPARPDHRGARWDGGRGGRLRRGHHRCRERPGAGHPDCQVDGRPLGHVRPDRAAVGAAPEGGEPAGQYTSSGTLDAVDEEMPPHRRGVLRRGTRDAARQPGEARRALGGAAGEGDAGRSRGVRRSRSRSDRRHRRVLKPARSRVLPADHPAGAG